MPEPSPAAVVFRGVSFSLDDQRKLIHHLSFEVAPGETLVLLGRSGCGKTTTLKLVNRLLEPTEGDIVVEGRATRAWNPIALRRRIGYVIQEVGLFPHFTIAQNVGLVPTLEQWPAEKIHRRTHALLAMVGLDPNDFADRLPRELSGGQRQRVGVARALAADPPLLLLDEPFGALDPITRAEIQQEFLALQKRLRKTLIFVTHDVREAMLLATRIGLMKEGGLIFLGTPNEFRNAETPEVRSFLQVLEEIPRSPGGSPERFP